MVRLLAGACTLRLVALVKARHEVLMSKRRYWCSLLEDAINEETPAAEADQAAAVCTQRNPKHRVLHQAAGAGRDHERRRFQGRALPSRPAHPRPAANVRKLGNMPRAPSRRWPSAGRGRAAGEPLSTTHLWRLTSKSPAARAGLAVSARASRSAFFRDCHERF